VRILVVAATDLEIEPLLAKLSSRQGASRAAIEPPSRVPGSNASSGSRLRSYTGHGRTIDVLTTGVGMVAAAAWCSRALGAGTYDAAVNLGVCGSFDPSIAPGDVVHVVTDRMPELGAEDGDRFLSLQDLGLLRDDEFPFRDGRLVNEAPARCGAIDRLRRVDGITVNTVHGHEATIARVVERLHPQVESMEGAAFLYACLIHGVPCAQVRAVSNVVERRNRAAWKLADAIRHLNAAAGTLLEQL
jgi:futalosine hydrolase